MNRREFCQTTALLLAGSMGVSTSRCSEKRMPCFRAQKVFLESWDAENDRNDSQRTISFVRKKMAIIRRDGADGLILMSGYRAASEWKEVIEAEAGRFDLKTFVPTVLSRALFDRIRAAIPLSEEAGVLRSIDEKSAENGGFFLLDEKSDVFGLVLCDLSRCLWSVFALSDGSLVQEAGEGADVSRLTVARWLDRTVSHC